MTKPLTSQPKKPLLDEDSFQQLLSAAFVLQEHNDRLQEKEPEPGYPQTLSEIAETQRLIQARQLDLEAVAKLIVQRAQKITNASGVAVGIAEKGELVYRAGIGTAASDVGTRKALAACLSAGCLANGRTLQCSDSSADPRVPAQSRPLAKALIAAPVFHEGAVAGVLELRFAKANCLRKEDVRTAELLAGLVGSAVVATAQMELKQAVASERKTMLEALEKIKPQLERLRIESPASKGRAATSTKPVLPGESASVLNHATVPAEETCRSCGHAFAEGESFCGVCGMARRGEAGNGGTQSKWASLWLMQQQAKRKPDENSGENPERSRGASDSLPAWRDQVVTGSVAEENLENHALPRMLARTASNVPGEAESEAAESEAAQVLEENETSKLELTLDLLDPSPAVPPSAAPPAQPDAHSEPGPSSLAVVPIRIVPADLTAASGIQPSPWASARKALVWLETLKQHQHPRAIWLRELWEKHRANLYVGVAALILLIVLVQLAVSGGGSDLGPSASSAAGPRHKVAQPQLTPFEKLLVSLGLAEPPAAPSYLGNPNAQVWVDVHTALYYCSGADFYGKTAGGKLTTQRDAQQDQFEPANRKVCE